ncbi:unnamed protein product [Rotaria sordida]|uniref:F-box domain-containing protein n=1 Tax=Rotaria sordida TaxID=392033 RepID=A0A814X3Y6_9BILA|nr:unnamed protein product [Rotaria sordida]CAF1487343.1 unnamed protein product [Rotaria sordida]
MQNYREEISSLSSTQPPYADFIGILSPPNINSPINTVINPILPKTRLHHVCEYFIEFLHYWLPLYLIFVFLLLAICQIILACHNCPLPNTDINWIRASLFMNIPFVLGGNNSMSNILLNRLPVELFDEILCYLSCCHILRAFYSINDYLNNILINYNNYFLDLSSSNISKNEIDLVCLLLRSEQIVGLKFGKTNFDLVKRFLSNFSNKQSFTRLRSLWIDDTIIVDQLFLSKLASIINYNKLISIRFDRIHLNNIILLSRYSFDSLLHLVVSSSNEFRQLSKEIPTHLIYLHMYFDSTNDMDQFIRPNMHQLKSLGVGIQCDINNIDQFMLFFSDYQLTQLIQFNLNFNVEINVQFDILEAILLTMRRLKYLTIILNKALPTNSDVLNGIQWKSFLSTSLIFLKIFNFKFSIEQQTSEYEIYSILNTFQSKWWLKDKQWFVEYDIHQNALITIPYFASKTFDNHHSYSFDLMQNPKIFYSNINSLNIDLVKYNELEQILMSQSVNRPCFNHVTQLSLNGYLTTDICDTIRNNIDLSIIKHFEFSSTIGTNQAFIQLIDKMINLSSIHIQYLHSLDLFNQLLLPYFSIRHLILFD